MIWHRSFIHDSKSVLPNINQTEWGIHYETAQGASYEPELSRNGGLLFMFYKDQKGGWV